LASIFLHLVFSSKERRPILVLGGKPFTYDFRHREKQFTNPEEEDFTTEARRAPRSAWGEEDLLVGLSGFERVW
jgi:hypothetical protein